jgi:hypothetical protein
MPECKLGLNDRVLLEAQGRAAKGSIDLEDIKFHQYAVKLPFSPATFLKYCFQMTVHLKNDGVGNVFGVSLGIFSL